MTDPLDRRILEDFGFLLTTDPEEEEERRRAQVELSSPTFPIPIEPPEPEETPRDLERDFSFLAPVLPSPPPVEVEQEPRLPPRTLSTGGGGGGLGSDLASYGQEVGKSYWKGIPLSIPWLASLPVVGAKWAMDKVGFPLEMLSPDMQRAIATATSTQAYFGDNLDTLYSEFQDSKREVLEHLPESWKQPGVAMTGASMQDVLSVGMEVPPFLGPGAWMKVPKLGVVGAALVGRKGLQLARYRRWGKIQGEVASWSGTTAEQVLGVAQGGKSIAEAAVNAQAASRAAAQASQRLRRTQQIAKDLASGGEDVSKVVKAAQDELEIARRSAQEASQISRKLLAVEKRLEELVETQPKIRKSLEEVHRRLKNGNLDTIPDPSPPAKLADASPKGIERLVEDVGYAYYGNRETADTLSAFHSLSVKNKTSLPARVLATQRRKVVGWGKTEYPGLKPQDLPKAFREDLTFFALQSSRGNPGRLGDTVDLLIKRIQSHPQFSEVSPIIEDFQAFVTGTYNAQKKLVFEIAEKAGKDIKKGATEKLSTRESWLDSLWRTKPSRDWLGRVEKPKEQSQPVQEFFQGFSSGVTEGNVPDTIDFAEMYQRVFGEAGRIGAIQRVIKDAANVNIGDDGLSLILRKADLDRLPLGDQKLFRRFDNSLLDEHVPGSGNLYMHEQLVDRMKPLLTQRSMSKTEHLFGTAKSMHFFFSTFHAWALSESLLASRGVFTGMREAARFRFGLPLGPGGFPIPVLARDPELLAAPEKIFPMLEAAMNGRRTAEKGITRAFHAGIQTGPPSTDYMRKGSEKFFREVLPETLGRIPIVGKPLKGTAKAVAWLQQNANVALWDRFHGPVKITMFNILSDRLIAAKRGELPLQRIRPFLRILKGRLEDLDDVQIERRVAAFVNDEFGGQNLELATNKFLLWLAKPGVYKTTRVAMESIDWNVSSVRQNWALTQAFKSLGRLVSLIPGVPNMYDPVRGALGLRHSRNVAFGLAFWGNVANRILTMSDKEPTGHWMWENQVGEKTSVDMGELFRDPQTGRKVFGRLGKSLHDATFGWSTDHPKHKYAASKVSATLRPVVGAVSLSFSRFIDSYVEEGRQLGMTEKSLLKIKEALGGVSSFSLGYKAGAEGFIEQFDKDPAKAVAMQFVRRAVPIPQHMGLSLTEAEVLMTESRRRGDSLKIEEIVQTLRQNNYSQEQIRRILSSSKRKAQKYPKQSLPKKIGRVFGAKGVERAPQSL